MAGFEVEMSDVRFDLLGQFLHLTSDFIRILNEMPEFRNKLVNGFLPWWELVFCHLASDWFVQRRFP